MMVYLIELFLQKSRVENEYFCFERRCLIFVVIYTIPSFTLASFPFTFETGFEAAVSAVYLAVSFGAYCGFDCAEHQIASAAPGMVVMAAAAAQTAYSRYSCPSFDSVVR